MSLPANIQAHIEHLTKQVTEDAVIAKDVKRLFGRDVSRLEIQSIRGGR